MIPKGSNIYSKNRDKMTTDAVGIEQISRDNFLKLMT